MTVTAGIDFDMQMTFWGYALTGPGILDFAATISEDRTTEPSSLNRNWDDTASLLRHIRVNWGNGLYADTPDWYALPWVGEHIRRLRMEGQVL